MTAHDYMTPEERFEELHRQERNRARAAVLKDLHAMSCGDFLVRDLQILLRNNVENDAEWSQVKLIALRFGLQVPYEEPRT